jgi:TonB family protein
MPLRQRDRETEGRIDGETERQGDGSAFSFRLSVSLSLCLAISLCLSVSVAGSIQTESFEKQALSSVRATTASDLDAQLPGIPFGGWLEQVLGAQAGVIWQLAECGEQVVAPGGTGLDIPACAEINAILPDRRRVFVAIRVGTFKKGLAGKPAFFGAAIQQNDQLFQVRRLYELPEMLRAPVLSENAPATVAKNRIADLPAIIANPAQIITPSLSPSSSAPTSPAPTSPAPNIPGSQTPVETPPPPTPRRSPQEPEKVSENVVQSRAITRAKPVYPLSAKKMNATGAVEVEITISEEGLVIEAVAVSGHIALRSAAVDAARKWVFKPAVFNGAPVKVKSSLTFIFAPGEK